MYTNESKSKQNFPPQHQQTQPGIEKDMHPVPTSIAPDYKASGKLQNKVAVITGGDSGIGRSVAYHYAKEGANVVVTYLNEHDDANETKNKLNEWELLVCCLLVT